MESVQERMKRLGTYEKIASFMQKEKQPYEFKRRLCTDPGRGICHGM